MWIEDVDGRLLNLDKFAKIEIIGSFASWSVVLDDGFITLKIGTHEECQEFMNYLKPQLALVRQPATAEERKTLERYELQCKMYGNPSTPIPIKI